MRKHLPEIILGLLFLVFLTPVARAGEAEWQIRWQEDGSLQETVSVSGQLVENADSTWQKTSPGDRQVFSRTIKNWQEYNNLKDKLPVKANQSNYIVCTITEIKPDPQAAEGTLYADLSGKQPMNLQIEVPGMIRDSSADQTVQNSAIWQIEKPGTAFSPAFTLKAITLDGWMLGISILTLGVIIMFIFFVGRMRRVDRIIAETYSLDNINIEDDENE